MTPAAPPACSLSTYAVVVYLPEPVSGFVNSLRMELEEQDAVPRAHLTVLAPRPLVLSAAEVSAEVAAMAAGLSSFEVGIGEVAVFPTSSVIYLSVGEGTPRLVDLHRDLNGNNLHFAEAFPYCPHVTLAQCYRLEEMEEKLHLARRRWSEYAGPRSFTVQALNLVLGGANQQWLDLGGFALRGGFAPRGRFALRDGREGARNRGGSVE